jgi:hypothetical protein
MSTPPPSPETPAPRTRRRSRGLLVVAVLALLLVAAIVVIVLTRGGGSDEGERADKDAAVACELLEDLHADTTLDDLDPAGPEYFELQAIGSLARAAGNADGAYDELGEAGEDLVAANARLHQDELEESLGLLRSECDDID